MCGFVITNLKKNIQLHKKVLNHRGPDDSAIFENDYVSIIFNRLSIIDDRKRSNQPFIKNKLLITFNGEIYNYIELRKILISKGHKFKTNSDTEVLLTSYIEWGEGCLNKLEGMFVFCIYNIKDNSIFMARDRFGIKPLFYFFKKNKFIFSSEKKAIFKLGIKKNINKFTISNYIAHGVYQNEKYTFYKDIFSLLPGTYLKLNNGILNFYNWHSFNIKKNNKIKYNEAKEEFNYLFKKSIKLCLRSDKNIAICSSGGVDSSSIIKKFYELRNKDIVKSLVHYSCSDEYDEKDFAYNFSKKINKKITISTFTKQDFYNYLSKTIRSIEEPFGGLNNMSGRKMFEILKKEKIKVIIDGNGADEILGGYQHHINAFNNNSLNYSKQQIHGLKIKYYPDILLKENIKLINEFKITKIFNDPLKDSMHNDLMGSKLRRSMIQNDHNAMSESLEMRFPFLNNELVNFCYSLPNNFLIQKNYGKYILRDLFNDSIFWDYKRVNQTPQIKWMGEFIINDLINDLKANNKIFDFQLFDKKNLLKKLNEWKKSKIQNSVFPWQILMINSFIKYCF